MLEEIWPNRIDLIHDDDLFDDLFGIGIVFDDFENNIKFFVEVNFSTASFSDKVTLVFELMKI